MPDWLTIVIAVSGLVGTIFGILGMSSYINERMKHKAQRKNKAEDNESEEMTKLKHEMYLNELRSIIDNAIAPLNDNIIEIKDDLHKVKKGVQATCRNDLEDMYAKAERDGYCSNEDKQMFEATYQVYHSLGKNGVMDAKRDKLLALPETKQKRKSTTKKKVLLLEDK